MPRPDSVEELCKEVLQRSGGRAAVVIVVGGGRGTSIGVQEDFSVAGGEYTTTRLPTLLRYLAGEIEKNLNGTKDK